MIYFCRPCKEPSMTAECPFCDNEAVPWDEIANVTNLRMASLASEMFQALLQYRDDLRHPPEGDSLERRLERVLSVIAKVEAAA